MDFIHPWGAELSDSPGNLSPSDRRAQPKVLWLCFLSRVCVDGIEEIFVVFLPPPNYRLSSGQQLPSHTEECVERVCFPLLSRQTVCQNFFGVDLKSCSMASTNSSHARVFASVTAQITWPANNCLLPRGLSRPAMTCKSPSSA